MQPLVHSAAVCMAVELAVLQVHRSIPIPEPRRSRDGAVISNTCARQKPLV